MMAYLVRLCIYENDTSHPSVPHHAFPDGFHFLSSSFFGIGIGIRIRFDFDQIICLFTGSLIIYLKCLEMITIR